MKSIAGGVVRYEGIRWAPCPEAPDVVGECLGAGVIEVLQGERVCESFDVARGDVLAVPDGAQVAAGGTLFERSIFISVRASTPEGVAATLWWSDEPVPTVDDVTGLTRPRFPTGDDDVTATFRGPNDRVIGRMLVSRHATPLVLSGTSVRRRQLIARMTPRAMEWDPSLRGTEGMQDFLDARLLSRRTIAVLAPCDACVETIAVDRITLRARDGRLITVRRRRGRSAVVCQGDDVRAGDVVLDGQRSHHRLLRTRGERWLAQHLLAELSLFDLGIPSPYLSLIIRAMLAWRRVRRPGDTGLRRNQVLAKDDFERIQDETVRRGGQPAEAVTVLRGFHDIERSLALRSRP